MVRDCYGAPRPVPGRRGGDRVRQGVVVPLFASERSQRFLPPPDRLTGDRLGLAAPPGPRRSSPGAGVGGAKANGPVRGNSLLGHVRLTHAPPLAKPYVSLTYMEGVRLDCGEAGLFVSKRPQNSRDDPKMLFNRHPKAIIQAFVHTRRARRTSKE